MGLATSRDLQACVVMRGISRASILMAIPLRSREQTMREDDMRISVIGTGYLGAVHAACMAELGHEVLGVDNDAQQDRGAGRGAAPF